MKIAVNLARRKIAVAESPLAGLNLAMAKDRNSGTYFFLMTKHNKCTVFPFIVIHDPPQCEYVDTCMSLVYYQCQIEMYCLFFIVQSIYVGKLVIICFCKYMEKP